ncbi:MAG: DNA polymerase III subunit alpha [Francisellaceae bacterium]|jgi:DNA polymerase III subunit alpha|nr:DNA polymerase III subunit alpha [Francisellaceae bacterium]MBT6539544.1 DNA polymerase III subunit alpha [Francisellaceae bacterium]
MGLQFIHLQCSSEYSLRQGLIKLGNVIKNAQNNKMPAVAITDKNNLFGMVKFYKKARLAKVKPIIGVEVNICGEKDEPGSKVLIYCKSVAGYKNLAKLITQSYHARENATETLYILKEWLTKKTVDGLIAIVVGFESNVGTSIRANNLELAGAQIEHWMSLFLNNLYLGVSRCNRTGEHEVIHELVGISHKLNCPLVALNDVCITTAEDYEAHKAKVCIHDGKTITDSKHELEFSKDQYFKSQEEMVELFHDLPEACLNTVEIAKRCTLFLELDVPYLPNFIVPKGSNVATYLSDISKGKLIETISERGCSPKFTIDSYNERLEVELSVINSMGFAGYFLIVSDFIAWAKSNDIPVGPGRGSGAGSLVAYVLGITDIDPLAYDLLFERFLNPERVSMPDFDIDFCMEGRDRVIDYVAQKYGRDAVSQIITYGTMAAKAVIRDVGRVMGQPYGFVDKIAKLIPMEVGITLTLAMEQEEELRKRYRNEEEVKTLIDLAKKLEGSPRNVGRHAGGVVIAPNKIVDFAPLYTEYGNYQPVAQFDKNDIESIGLVKFDFLGLRTLTIINWAVKTVNASANESDKIDITKIPLKDERTFSLLQQCITTAVFQLESRGMKDLIRRLKPDCFEDIVALVALFRPGPLQSGMVDDFIDRKLGRAEIEYPHPDLGPILQPTYGVILYQEQVMQIAQILAGYTLGAADVLRRAMGKKNLDEMAKQREIFVSGAVERGVVEATAAYIFDLMEKFAGYGFNKSHSAAYALVAYQTAWLKAHHTAAFMAAVLSSDMANTDKTVFSIDECKSLKIKVLVPCVNKSIYHFTTTDENLIRYGLGAIKGVGEGAIEAVLKERNRGGEFKDLLDFCSRMELRKVNKKVMEALVYSGAMDVFGEHRAALMYQLPATMQAAEKMQSDLSIGQNDLFGLGAISAETICGQATTIKPWPERELLRNEKNTLGLYFSGHPITEYEKKLEQMRCTQIKDLEVTKNIRISGFLLAIRTMITKRGDKMAFITIEDRTSRQEIAVFADVFKDKTELLVKDTLLVVEGLVDHDKYSGGLRVRATKILSFAEAVNEHTRALSVRVDATKVSEEDIDMILNTIDGHVDDTFGKPVRIIYKNAEGLAVINMEQKCKITVNLLDELSNISNTQGELHV